MPQWCGVNKMNLRGLKKMAKLNLSIDMSDLFFEVNDDEGGAEFSFNEILKDAVIGEVKAQVRKLAQDEIKSVINEFIQNDLVVEVRAGMRAHLNDFLVNKKLTGKYNDLTVAEIIERNFDNEIGRNDSIGREVGKLAEKWGANLKAQYDAAFATRIVHKLNEEGLLLPTAAQLLLSK
jgi:hypothetical protein